VVVEARREAAEGVCKVDVAIRGSVELPGRTRRPSTFAGLCLLIVAAVGAPGYAADIPAMVVKAPAVVVADPWTGLYLGAHAGYGWGHKTFVNNFPVYDGIIDADTHAQGGLFGIQLGYNHYAGGLVVGAEGEFSWSDVHNTDFPCFFFGDQLCSARAQWFATLAGRIGVARGSGLLYLKGGAAVVHDHFDNIATCAGSQPTSSGGIPAACGDPFSAEHTRFGWMFGVGIEHFFARDWSLKLEYDHMDFSGRSVPFEDGGTGFFTEEIHQRIDVVKLGLNYHFEWGAAVASPLNARGDASVTASDMVDESYRVLAFTGADIAKHSYDAWAGAFIAPSGDLDTSGPRVLILAEGGTYKYAADTGTITGVNSGGSLLAGRGFEGDNYSINVLAGISAANHMLSAIDPTNSVQGTAFGAKLRADAWVNPTPRSMVYGEMEYSTAFRSYLAKIKLGYDVTPNRQVFVGPEIAASGNERYDQWRVGAHVTQLKLGRVQMDVSAGYVHDSSVGASAYGTTEFSTNF
jgi:outer membrane immunogenic protein